MAEDGAEQSHERVFKAAEQLDRFVKIVDRARIEPFPSSLVQGRTI